MSWRMLLPLLLALGFSLTLCHSLPAPVVDGEDLAQGAKRPAVVALDVNAHGDVQNLVAGGSAATIRRQRANHKLEELRENVTSGEQRKAHVLADMSPKEEQFKRGELPWFCRSFGLLQSGSQTEISRQEPFEDEQPLPPPDGTAPETEWTSSVLPLAPPPPPQQQPVEPGPPAQPINVIVPAPDRPREPTRSIEDIIGDELVRFESYVASHIAWRVTIMFGCVMPLGFLVALCFTCILPFKYATHVKFQQERMQQGLSVKPAAKLSLPWLYEKGWRLILGMGSTISALLIVTVAILGSEYQGLDRNLKPVALADWILKLFEGVISLMIIASQGEEDQGWWNLFCNLLRTGYTVKSRVTNQSEWSLHVRRILGSLTIAHASVYDIDTSWPFMPPNTQVTTTTAVVAKQSGLSFAALRLGLGQIFGSEFVEFGAKLNINSVIGGREIKVSTYLNVPCKTRKIQEVIGDSGLDVVRLTECIDSGFGMFQKLQPPKFLISWDDTHLSGSYIGMMTALIIVLGVLLTLLLALCFGIAMRWVGERKELFPNVQPLRTTTPGSARSGYWQPGMRSRPDKSAAQHVYYTY